MDKSFVYSEKKANATTIWLLFLFLGWSYGSLGQIGLQILFYITLGGFGIWALIRLFTLSGAIKKYNKNIAMGLGFSNEELVAMGLV
jgi:hypothetical protein